MRLKQIKQVKDYGYAITILFETCVIIPNSLYPARPDTQ